MFVFLSDLPRFSTIFGEPLLAPYLLGFEIGSQWNAVEPSLHQVISYAVQFSAVRHILVINGNNVLR